MALSTESYDKQTLHYLGPVGSYHSIVARGLESEFHLQPEESFEDIFAALGPNDQGLVAIENSHTGDIQPNFGKLLTGEYRVLGEYELAINHMIMTHPSKTLDQVTKIYVHPQIMLQCSRYLHTLPNHKKISVNASSEGAQKIAQGDTDAATIGSIELAQEYNLEVRQKNIGNETNNVTRFFRITAIDTNIDNFAQGQKVAITFSLPHTFGALSNVLSFFTLQKANLTKIESIPLAGKVWEYQFFVEMIIEVPFGVKNFQHLVSSLQVIGVY